MSGQATPMRLSLPVRLQEELCLCSSLDPLLHTDEFVRKQEKLKMGRGLIPSHSEAGESRTPREAQVYLLLKANPHLPGATGAARGVH